MNATVSEQLPLLAAAPNGIRKLRELILELAVRGKLVAQDPSDEPAGELLKRIAAEKKRLVGEGKIKQPKLPAKIAEKEKPFELPTGWEWTRLTEIAFSQAGFAFKSNSFNHAGIGLPLIRIRDVGQPFSGTFYEGEYRSEFLVERGDYLISMDGEFRIAAWNGGSALLNQRVSRLIFFGAEMARRFIADSLQARLLERQGIKAYTTVDHLSGGQISEAIIGLPPLGEQHRIVAKVDELMALCDQLEAQQADAESAHTQLVTTLLDSLTQTNDADDFAASWQRLSAHFHTLFTTESSIDALKRTLLQLAVMGKLVPQDTCDEPAAQLLEHLDAVKLRLTAEDGLRTTAKNDVSDDERYLQVPDSWVYRRLGNLARFIDYRGRTPNKVSAGIPLITAKNVRFGFVSREPREFIAVGDYQSWMTRGFPRMGDVLFTTEAPLGNIALVDISERFALAQRVICFQLHELSMGPFLRLAMMSTAVQVQFGNAATGMTATGIKASRLKEIPIPIPPLAEQHRIVAKVDQLMTLCDNLRAAIQRRNQHSRHLADALVGEALSPVTSIAVNVVDLSCYLVNRLVAKPAFGRTTHMKLIYFLDTHLGFDLEGEYMREAAGPLDKNIYKVEQQAEASGWYTHSETLLKSGKPKVTYQATDALAAKAQQVAEELGGRRQDVDHLIALLGDKKTDDVQIIATLFAAWNDALLDGQSPSDDWIVREVRENWHVEKQRFTPNQLRHWLAWMRQNQLVPTGKLPHTQQQTQMFQ